MKALAIGAFVVLVLMFIWLLTSCAEPEPECGVPLIMINSTLVCPEQKDLTHHG